MCAFSFAKCAESSLLSDSARVARGRCTDSRSRRVSNDEHMLPCGRCRTDRGVCTTVIRAPLASGPLPVCPVPTFHRPPTQVSRTPCTGARVHAPSTPRPVAHARLGGGRQSHERVLCSRCRDCIRRLLLTQRPPRCCSRRAPSSRSRRPPSSCPPARSRRPWPARPTRRWR